MKKIIIIISFCFSLYANVFEGFTLFTPKSADEDGATTILLDINENTIHTWSHEFGPASMPYLLQDSSIIYPFRVETPTMISGGVGGGIHKIKWDGEIEWEYIVSNETYQHHHDIQPLPNGNILLIVWENKSAQEAFEMGREIINNPLNQMWSTAILELNLQTGNIDWEWHLWDHLIQDVDSEKPNFGVISEHPELFDINCGSVGSNAGGPEGANADWMHINAIDYNQILDQIIISSRLQNEIFIIDHSTSTSEAGSNEGGNSAMGGDILFRWGNPSNYGRGDSLDEILNSQHSINWIPMGYPGEGNLILFNNFHENGQSAVLEIVPPMTDDGLYLLNEGEPFGPETWEWMFMGDFITPMQGGAFRLPNGNTIITQTHTARIIEVETDGSILWDYEYVTNITNYWIARANKYSLDYLNPTIVGDLNGDEFVNVQDIILLVNNIINEEVFFASGDLNSDGIINILDILELVNLIVN